MQKCFGTQADLLWLKHYADVNKTYWGGMLTGSVVRLSGSKLVSCAKWINLKRLPWFSGTAWRSKFIPDRLTAYIVGITLSAVHDASSNVITHRMLVSLSHNVRFGCKSRDCVSNLALHSVGVNASCCIFENNTLRFDKLRPSLHRNEINVRI